MNKKNSDYVKTNDNELSENTSQHLGSQPIMDQIEMLADILIDHYLESLHDYTNEEAKQS